MPHNRGDIILVPFPFTDLSGRKRRPGLVVSADSYNTRQHDLVVAQVSSVIATPLPADEYVIKGWENAGLLYPSVVRPKLFTLEDSLVLGTLGRLSATEMSQVDQRLRVVLAL
jgi:mRNA interferase MazF